MDPQLLGVRIRQARERLGMAQDDLAAAVMKDQRAISEYEHGSRKLSATDLPLFAQALHVPLLYFYEGELTADDLDMMVLSQFHRLVRQPHFCRNSEMKPKSGLSFPRK